MTTTENPAPAEDEDDSIDDTEVGNDLTPRAADLDAERKEADKATDAQLVAQRSADTNATSSNEHVKIFVLPPGPKPTATNGFSHEANFAAVRQYMMQQGLRPTGDVRHVSTKAHKGNEAMGWDLTYAVPAVPAERFDFRRRST